MQQQQPHPELVVAVNTMWMNGAATRAPMPPPPPPAFVPPDDAFKVQPVEPGQQASPKPAPAATIVEAGEDSRSTIDAQPQVVDPVKQGSAGYVNAVVAHMAKGPWPCILLYATFWPYT